MLRVLTLFALTALVAAAVPGAAAEPGYECHYEYPWPEVCDGDVLGLVAGATMPEVDVRPQLPEPACIQVIPWSYLCSGQVGRFLEYYVDELPPCVHPRQSCTLPDCLPHPMATEQCIAPHQTVVRVLNAVGLGEPACIQIVPWSYLCSGDVRGFLAYYLDMIEVKPVCGPDGLRSCLAVLPPPDCPTSVTPGCPGPDPT